MSTVIPFFAQKIISTIALLVITAIFSYLPFLIKSRVRKAGLIMSYCNCLAGGIVLGAMLMHMVPEMMEGASACDGAHSHSHAVAPALVKPASAGLFTLPDLPLAKHNGDGHSHKHSHSHKHEKKTGKSVKAAKTDKHDHDHHHGHSHAHSHDEGHSHGFAWGPFFAGVSFLVLFAVDRLFLTHSHCADAHPPKMAEAKKLADENDHGHDHEHHHHHGHDCHGHSHHHAELSLQPDAEHGPCHEDDVIGGCHMDGINSSSTQAQTFVFVLALSIHSFLEGLGMSSKSTWNSLLSFMISLFAHKWLEAFALGTSVAKACFSPFHAFLLIAFYALLTPAGILLGMAMDTWSQSTSPLTVQITRQVLDGLALGSFLFVSCIEMIPSEFHRQNKHSPFKFTILCLGFLAMAAISMLHFH